MEHRIYSLNLAAYVLAVTNVVPDTLWDPDSKTAYWRFPEIAGVQIAVRQYKNNNPVGIQDLLRAIKTLRTMIEVVKAQNGGDKE